jgi:hypothetical protein
VMRKPGALVPQRAYEVFVVTTLTNLESEGLIDICCGENVTLLNKKIYEALCKGDLAYKTLGGYWLPTPKGRSRAVIEAVRLKD